MKPGKELIKEYEEMLNEAWERTYLSKGNW